MESIKLSELFYNNVLELPIWVKQVLHNKTKEDLNQALDKYLNILNPDGLVQELQPELTYKGKKILEGMPNDFSQEEIIFVNSASHGYNLFDITLTNFWSLEMTCKIISKLIKEEIVRAPRSENTLNLIEFLAGRLKTGDILKKMGIVDVVQVDEALRYQQEKKKDGINIRIADIMIKLGFIEEKDVEILIKLKEDSKKHFIMTLGLTTIKAPDEKTKDDILVNLQREHKRLVQENDILKSRLRKLLNIKK